MPASLTPSPTARTTLNVAAAAIVGCLAVVAAHAAPLPRTAVPMSTGTASPTASGDMFKRALNAALAARARAEAGFAPKATLSYPYGITVDQHSNVYVTNLFSGVNVYTYKLVKTGEITANLLYPSAVAISFSGNIYVANNGASNVTIYNPALAQVGTITDAMLQAPTSMYIDADDTAWVLDAQGNLHAYLSDGVTLASVHSGGTALGPWGPYVTVWGVTDAKGGYDEAFASRAQALNSGIAFSGIFPQGSPEAGSETQDQHGNQYVSDIAHNQIMIYDAAGTAQIGTITTPAAVYGIAVDPNLNRLYAVMTAMNEVYTYSTIAPYKMLGVIH